MWSPAMSVMRNRLRVQAFGACASSRCRSHEQQPQRSSHNANFCIRLNVYRRRRIMPSLRLTIFGFTCGMQNQAHEPYKVGTSLLSETVMPAGLVTRVLALYRGSAHQPSLANAASTAAAIDDLAWRNVVGKTRLRLSAAIGGSCERYAKPVASAGLLGLRERSVQVARAATSHDSQHRFATESPPEDHGAGIAAKDHLDPRRRSQAGYAAVLQVGTMVPSSARKPSCREQ
jgi:hypothetical protein